jgi:Tfp pilus assembly protein PilN
VNAGFAVMQPRVNLLPQRVKDRRSMRGRRRGSIMLVVISLIVVGLAYGGLTAYQQMLQARLDSRLDTQQELLAEQRSYAEIAGILDETQLVEHRLEELLVDDIAPAEITRALREALPDGSTLTGLTFSIPGADGAASSAPGGASAALDGSGEIAIGQIEITGTGRSQREILAYSENLEQIAGLRLPYVVSTRTLEDARGNAFTLRVTITDEARTGRYAGENE